MIARPDQIVTLILPSRETGTMIFLRCAGTVQPGFALFLLSGDSHDTGSGSADYLRVFIIGQEFAIQQVLI